MQRANPHPVSRENQYLLAGIIESERELTAQFFQHPLTKFFPKVNKDFSIAAGLENMSQRLKLAPLLGKIEKFPVEDDRDRLVFVVNRLLTIT